MRETERPATERPATAGSAVPLRRPGPATAPAPSAPSPCTTGRSITSTPSTSTRCCTGCVREEPVALVRMRFGEGHAWLVTRYEYVKEVTSDPRSAERSPSAGR
ncbi:hypothetical protein ACFSNO_33030 [Streptomyces cirratus]